MYLNRNESSKREFLRNCARIRKTSDPDLKSEDPRIPDPDPDPKINFPRIRIRIRIKKCISVRSGSRIRICIISRIRITSDPKIRSPHSDLRSDIGSYDPCITTIELMKKFILFFVGIIMAISNDNYYPKSNDIIGANGL